MNASELPETIERGSLERVVGPLSGVWQQVSRFRRIGDEWHAEAYGELLPLPAIRITAALMQWPND